MMYRWTLLACGVSLAWACDAPPKNLEPASSPGNFAAPTAPLPAATDDSPDAPPKYPYGPENTKLFEQFAEKTEAALGTFDDIKLYERSASGEWQLLTGQYVPVTVNGETPKEYKPHMQSDRPMMLPTQVEGFHGGDGQSSPYSVVGRMPGSNPETQWVFTVRQYYIKKPTDNDFPQYGDMAVIGHHPRTGATIFLQFYEPEKPKSGVVVQSLWSDRAADFWSPIKKIADEFKCQRCHSTDPFIHTPWVNQVRVGEKDSETQPIVPSSPLGPYFYLDSEEGGLFEQWDSALKVEQGGGHLKCSNEARTNNKCTKNRCTECHRIAPELLGLNQNSTRYAGLQWQSDGFSGFNSLAVLSDDNQTAAFRKLTWMPPQAPAPPYVNFYEGQEAAAASWRDTYGDSADEVNQLTKDGQALSDDPTTGLAWRKAIERGLVADVPRPPKEYQTILVDRPEQDQLAANQTLWIIDSRMQANTDGTLESWQFYAKQTNASVHVAPVVYRRKPTDPHTVEYEVVFVGEPRAFESGGKLVPIQGGKTFPLKLGDYLGVVFTNTSAEASAAPIPYSNDDWAKLTDSNGVISLREGSVIYRLKTQKPPAVGKTLSVSEAEFATYSFEFRNKL